MTDHPENGPSSPQDARSAAEVTGVQSAGDRAVAPPARSKSTRSPTLFIVPVGTRAARCRSCGATVYWIVTAAGRKMPVDCAAEGGRPPQPASSWPPPAVPDSGLGVSHFATCPHADRHRRAR